MASAWLPNNSQGRLGEGVSCWTFFRPLIILEEDKLLNYVAAAVVNCLNQRRVEQIVDRGYAARIFERISVFGGREDSMVAYEAVFDLAGYLLECPVVAQRDYDLLTLSAR